MILADQILAAAGGPSDLGGMVASFAETLRRAERFVLSDEVAVAAYQLAQSRPSSLVSAMALCRAPYPTVWLEWDGGVLVKAGRHLEPYGVEPDDPQRVQATRLGCLIESHGQGQRGFMTWAWHLPVQGVVVCGISVAFDYGGHVGRWMRAHVPNDPRWTANIDLWEDRTTIPKDQVVKLLRSTEKWHALAHNPTEQAALVELGDYTMFWPSRHAFEFLRIIREECPPEAGRQIMVGWMGDMSGEAPFVSAVLAMLCSPNALEHREVELERLNRARRKNGKEPILSHRITRLHLTRARLRDAAASGMTRAEMRAHLVRGHFKVRRSGVFWWMPFVRGRGRTVERKRYEVDT
jgi:hypothetical protein